MRRKLDQASSSSQSATLEADIVEIVTERKVIHFSADEDLLSIIWIANLKLWIRMKILFYLKADSYYQLPCIEVEDHILHQSEQVRSPIYLDHVVADSYVNYHVLRLEDNILHQSEQVRSPIYLDHVVVSKISLLIDKTRKLRICFLVFWPSDWNFYTVSSIVEVKKYRIDIFCELNSIQYHGLFSY
ncbi:unnamed protein product [Rhizophagus irregularis]|nr:unnamed protein product [Rhizophagus irregularis]